MCRVIACITYEGVLSSTCFYPVILLGMQRYQHSRLVVFFVALYFLAGKVLQFWKSIGLVLFYLHWNQIEQVLSNHPIVLAISLILLLWFITERQEPPSRYPTGKKRFTRFERKNKAFHQRYYTLKNGNTTPQRLETAVIK